MPITTIPLQTETRDKLKAAKVYKRETYDEAINRLLEAGKHGK